MLELYDIYGLGTFFSLRDLEFYGLALIEGFESVSLDSSIVDEDISTAFFFNEAIPLCVVEPLHLSCCHQLDLPALVLPAKTWSSFTLIPSSIFSC